MKIYQSMDYGKFEIHQLNRPTRIDKNLEESMKRHGWIDAYPMHVVKNGNGKMKIKAGHNRFETAKRLGIPVKYCVCSDDATIHELEKSTKSWSVSDYLESYVSCGNPHYAYLKNFHKETGIGISACMSMLSGESAGSNNKLYAFKDGRFEPTKDGIEHANTVAAIVKACRLEGAHWANSAPFVSAISRMLWVKEFSPEEFVKRVKKHHQFLEKQRSIDGYFSMIENIYNFQRKGRRIPLSFLVVEVSRERQQTFGGNRSKSAKK